MDQINKKLVLTDKEMAIIVKKAKLPANMDQWSINDMGKIEQEFSIAQAKKIMRVEGLKLCKNLNQQNVKN